jgi:hypothetical protein
MPIDRPRYQAGDSRQNRRAAEPQRFGQNGAMHVILPGNPVRYLCASVCICGLFLPGMSRYIVYPCKFPPAPAPIPGRGGAEHWAHRRASLWFPFLPRSGTRGEGMGDRWVLGFLSPVIKNGLSQAYNAQATRILIGMYCTLHMPG